MTSSGRVATVGKMAPAVVEEESIMTIDELKKAAAAKMSPTVRGEFEWKRWCTPARGNLTMIGSLLQRRFDADVNVRILLSVRRTQY
jgi:hypothetical protein